MKIRMGKLEIAFWVILILGAGMILGAVFIALNTPKTTKKCNNGTYEEIRDNVKLKTYIPALDQCKENKDE